MSYPPGQYGGSPEWQGQPPEWQGQQPGWQAQQPGWQGQRPGWPAPQPGYGGQPEPDNYLVWAILVTVMCCIPFGIVSLVYSTKVSGLWSQGRYAEAQTAAANAKRWAIIGAITGPIIGVCIVVFYIVVIAVAVHDMPSVPTTTYSGY